jgi:hypothetical protein
LSRVKTYKTPFVLHIIILALRSCTITFLVIKYIVYSTFIYRLSKYGDYSRCFFSSFSSLLLLRMCFTSFFTQTRHKNTLFFLLRLHYSIVITKDGRSSSTHTKQVSIYMKLLFYYFRFILIIDQCYVVV